MIVALVQVRQTMLLLVVDVLSELHLKVCPLRLQRVFHLVELVVHQQKLGKEVVGDNLEVALNQLQLVDDLLAGERNFVFVVRKLREKLLQKSSCKQVDQVTLEDISSIFQLIVFFQIPSSISMLENLCSMFENLDSILLSMFKNCDLMRLR